MLSVALRGSLWSSELHFAWLGQAGSAKGSIRWIFRIWLKIQRIEWFSTPLRVLLCMLPGHVGESEWRLIASTGKPGLPVVGQKGLQKEGS